MNKGKTAVKSVGERERKRKVVIFIRCFCSFLSRSFLWCCSQHVNLFKMLDCIQEHVFQAYIHTRIETKNTDTLSHKRSGFFWCLFWSFHIYISTFSFCFWFHIYESSCNCSNRCKFQWVNLLAAIHSFYCCYINKLQWTSSDKVRDANYTARRESLC